MGTTVHTRGEGLRVHYLANLGGLAVLAGLENHPPDLLLGVLEEVAERIQSLSTSRLAELSARGKESLERRAGGKRAWRAWAQAKDLHRLDLTTTQLAELVAVLGGKNPADTRSLPHVVIELVDQRLRNARTQ